MNVPPIVSHRLELVSMSPAFVEAVLEGRRDEAASLLGAAILGAWPGATRKRFFRGRLNQMQRDPNAQQWLVRAFGCCASPPARRGG